MKFGIFSQSWQYVPLRLQQISFCCFESWRVLLHKNLIIAVTDSAKLLLLLDQPVWNTEKNLFPDWPNPLSIVKIKINLTLNSASNFTKKLPIATVPCKFRYLALKTEKGEKRNFGIEKYYQNKIHLNHVPDTKLAEGLCKYFLCIRLFLIAYAKFLFDSLRGVVKGEKKCSSCLSNIREMLGFHCCSLKWKT